MEHVQAKCTSDSCGGTCPACTLAVCDVCGGYEGSLTTECPGQKVAPEQLDLVYTGQNDFRDGKWIKAISIHSPEFCGIDRRYADELLVKNGLAPIEDGRSPQSYRVLHTLKQAYCDGYTDALKNYAVNKDGELLTAMGRNVKDLIKGLEKESVPVKYC